MGINSPAEHHLQEMSSILAPPVDSGEIRLEPHRKHEDSEREAIHIREERYDESAESTQTAQVSYSCRREEDERKEDENGDGNQRESTQTIAIVGRRTRA